VDNWPRLCFVRSSTLVEALAGAISLEFKSPSPHQNGEAKGPGPLTGGHPGWALSEWRVIQWLDASTSRNGVLRRDGTQLNSFYLSGHPPDPPS
jgi:hypothetical protein